MNKMELVSKVAYCAEISRVKAERAIDCYHDVISGALGRKERVMLVGFGTFCVSHRKQRIGVNPKTGEKLTIRAKDVPVFKPGKALKETVK